MSELHLCCECGAALHVYVTVNDDVTLPTIKAAWDTLHFTHESVSPAEARSIRDSERKRKTRWMQRRQHA